MAEAGPGTLVPVRPESELPNGVEPTGSLVGLLSAEGTNTRARPAFPAGYPGLLSRQVHIPSRYDSHRASFQEISGLLAPVLARWASSLSMKAAISG